MKFQSTIFAFLIFLNLVGCRTSPSYDNHAVVINAKIPINHIHQIVNAIKQVTDKKIIRIDDGINHSTTVVFDRTFYKVEVRVLNKNGNGGDILTVSNENGFYKVIDTGTVTIFMY